MDLRESFPLRHKPSCGGKKTDMGTCPQAAGVPAGAAAPAAGHQEHQPMGEVQLQICYDSQVGILYVTVLRARGLHTVREDGDTRPDSFIKVYLLPGRR